MKFRRLQEKISLIEHKINKSQDTQKLLSELSTQIPKEILTEMKKVGIENLPYSYSAL